MIDHSPIGRRRGVEEEEEEEGLSLFLCTAAMAASFPFLPFPFLT
jgi:hypothetical protein